MNRQLNWYNNSQWHLLHNTHCNIIYIIMNISFCARLVDPRPERWCPHTILDFVSCRQELRLDNHSLRHSTVSLLIHVANHPENVANSVHRPDVLKNFFHVRKRIIVVESINKFILNILTSIARYFAIMLIIFIKFLLCNINSFYWQSNLLCNCVYTGKDYWSMSWVVIVKYRIKSTYWKVGLHPP